MLRILIIDSTKKDPQYFRKWIENKRNQDTFTFEVISETELDRVMDDDSFDLLIHRVIMPAMHSNIDIKDLYPRTPLFVLPVFSYQKQDREEEDKHMVRNIIPKIVQKQVRYA